MMTAPVPPKSTFVTVVAWVFIILSGFATCISLLQNLVVGVVPGDLLDSAMRDTTFVHVMPPATRFMFTHLRLLVFGTFVLCALLLASSIGLLHRRNWARLVFIGLLGLGIAYNLAGLVLQQTMVSSMTSQFPPLDSAMKADSMMRSAGQQFDQMMAGLRVAMVVVAVGFSALFAWIIAKLVSRPIREEFVVSSDP